jgi:hypothetical protein
LSLHQHLAVDGALPVLIEAEAERVVQTFKAEVVGAAAIRTVQKRTMASEVRHSFPHLLAFNLSARETRKRECVRGKMVEQTFLSASNG